MRSALGGPPVAWDDELRRVVALPRRARPTAVDGVALAEGVTAWFRRERTTPCACAAMSKPCIERLRPEQAWALLELREERGLFGNIGTGYGKSFLNFLAPLALAGTKLALLLVPPKLVKQLRRQYEHFAQHFRVPGLRIHGEHAWVCPVAGEPALHVLPYSGLSSASCSTFLENLRPDLVIADECHMLKDVEAARTRRLERYLVWAEANEIDPRVVAYSGTVTSDSIRNYRHLVFWCLREGSPLPMSSRVGEEWARAIDPSDWPAPPGALAEALCDRGEHVQDGFHRRLVETPGVVVTSAPSCDVRFVIAETEPDGGVPPEVEALCDHVRETWERPDGLEIFETKFLQWACLRNLACGFYYRWVFPNGEPDDLVKYWVGRRKAWNRAVRTLLEENRPHLDSPLLVARAAERYERGEPDLENAPSICVPEWVPWRDVRDQVHPVSQGVRVHPFAAESAARWALDVTNGPGIVWFESVELGRWVAELSGLPYCGSGPEAEDIVEAEIASPVQRSIICSVRTHGTGRDGLQKKFRRQLVTQPFASADGWEQLAGRTVRPGQTGEVTLDAWTHSDELGDMLALAEMRAWYVQRTTGTRQKIIGEKTPPKR